MQSIRFFSTAALRYGLLAVLLIAGCDPAPEEPVPNVAPTIAIQSPAASDQPATVDTHASFRVSIADPDDAPSALSFRYAFANIANYGNDWDTAEDGVVSNPDALQWSQWIAYQPDGTSMAVTATTPVAFGFHVLVAQARDSRSATSHIDKPGLRRVHVATSAEAPLVEILSPARDLEPAAVSTMPTFSVRLTDRAPGTGDLMYRWALVRTTLFGVDYAATEEALAANPDGFAWSEWSVYAPDTSNAVEIAVPDPPIGAYYVFVVQANAPRVEQVSVLNESSFRRVAWCPPGNEAPSLYIQIPERNGLNPAVVLPSWALHYQASDPDNDPRDITTRWALVNADDFDGDYDTAIKYLQKDPAVLAQYGKTEADVENEWTEWEPYRQPGEILFIADYGRYVSAVVARDPCGAVTPLNEQYNIRRILISNADHLGPLMSLYNRFIGVIKTTVCNTPPRIAEMPSGLPVQFVMAADASAYGGVVAGYRYGWDIVDLDDPDQWDIDYTPMIGRLVSTPPRTFFYGTHVFTIEVIDGWGYCSRAQVKINFVPFTMSRNVLVVDDSKENPTYTGWNNLIGRGIYPNDAEHDAFWERMLDDVAGFDPVADVIDVASLTSIPLTKLADYKAIIWSTFSNVDTQTESALPLLYRYIKFNRKDNPLIETNALPDILALYMAAGGHLLICGQHPTSNVINRVFFTSRPRFPLVFLYELEGRQYAGPVYEPPGDESFAWRDLCVDALDFAVQSLNRERNEWVYCSIDGIRSIDADAVRETSLRRADAIDTHFAGLDLRPETAGPGKFHEPSNQGLDCEVYNPPYFSMLCPEFSGSRPCFEPIFGLQCIRTTEPTYNAPVAFWTSRYADVINPLAPDAVAARSAVIGFPPVLFDEGEVKFGLDYIFFDEWKLIRK